MPNVIHGKRAASRGVVAPYNQRRIVTVPNFLTACRILAAFGMWIFVNHHLIVFTLALFGTISDGIDGWLARKWKQVSNFGKRLDQFADFAFGIAIAYVLFSWGGTAWHNVPVIGMIAVYSVLVFGLRIVNLATESSDMAKWKIGLQLVAIMVILSGHTFEIPFALKLGYLALWYSLWPMGKSLLGYIKEARESLYPK